MPGQDGRDADLEQRQRNASLAIEASGGFMSDDAPTAPMARPVGAELPAPASVVGHVTPAPGVPLPGMPPVAVHHESRGAADSAKLPRRVKLEPEAVVDEGDSPYTALSRARAHAAMRARDAILADSLTVADEWLKVAERASQLMTEMRR